MTAPVWLAEALASVERTFGAAGPALDRRLARVAAHLSTINGGTSLATALTSPSSTPFLALLDAYAADLGLAADDRRLAAIGEGAISLYVYVRIQDDLVDEPEAWDRAFVYAAEVFANAGARAFAGAVGDAARFFAFREATLREFAGAAAWEIDDYRGGAEAEDPIAAIGRKFLPMAVPLGAVALAASRPDQLDDLRRFVIALGGGLQLVNDLLNVAEDHAAGRVTPVLRWLYERGPIPPETTPRTLRARLLRDEIHIRALAEARGRFADAERIAVSLGAPRLAAIVSARAATLDEVPTRLLALALGAKLPP